MSSDFKNLKKFLFVNRMSPPEKYMIPSKACLDNMPNKITAAEWLYFGRKRRFVVFPGEPTSSSICGVIQIAEWLAYPELKQVKTWRWEYHHDHGSALKIGKKAGLFIYDEDPLILPKICAELIHHLIFNMSFDDYIYKDGVSKPDYPELRNFLNNVWS